MNETNHPQTEVDWTASKQLAGLMGTNKECYLNAFHAMARYPNALYCEGWAVIRLNAEDENYFPMLFNHAWIEVDGKIIDPTPSFAEDRGNAYFPAIKWNGFELAMKLTEMGKNTLPVCEFEFFNPHTECGQSMIEAREEGETFLYGKTIREMFQNPKVKWLDEIPQVEEKYWGGHNWVEDWQVESSSSGNVYTVARDDKGRYGCSCPAWKFRRIECKHIKKIKAQQGENPGPGRWQKPTKVQSVVFKSKDWSVEKAKEWLRKHGFKYGKVDETPNEIRFRQFDPGHFAKGHFRSIPFGKGRGIRAIVAEPNPGTKKKALITWIPGTTKYSVQIIHEDGKRTKHTFGNDQEFIEGLWGIWHGFFQDNDKTKDLCPITTEWVAPHRNPTHVWRNVCPDCGSAKIKRAMAEGAVDYWRCADCGAGFWEPDRDVDYHIENPSYEWGSLPLHYDIPPQKDAPKRRFLHHCPPLTKDGVRRVDKKGLALLKECQKRIVQTKDMHTIPVKDESGGIIKDEKGKPIVRYTPKREELHQTIINHIMKNVECIAEVERPVAILTGGPPGSGKSRYIRDNFPWATISLSKGVLHIDADYIRGMLPEYEGWNASATHEETSDIVNKLLDNLGTPCKTDIVYDGTMSNMKKYSKLVERLKGMGYLVFFIFMEVSSPNVTFKRVKERYVKGGRWVPPEVVRDAHAKADVTFLALTSMADGYMKVDGESPEDEEGNIKWNIIEEEGISIPKIRPYWSPIANPKKTFEGFVTKAIQKSYEWGERWLVFVTLDAGQEAKLSVTPRKDRKLPEYGDIIRFSYHHINNGWWNVTPTCEFEIKQKSEGVEYRETGTVEKVSAVKYAYDSPYAKWFWVQVMSDKTAQIRTFDVYFYDVTETDIKFNYKPWIGEKVEYSIVDIPGKSHFVIEDGTETNRWRVFPNEEMRSQRAYDFRKQKEEEYRARKEHEREEKLRATQRDKETKKKNWMILGLDETEAEKLAQLDMGKVIHLLRLLARSPMDVGRGGKKAEEYGDYGLPGTGLRAPKMPFWGLPSSQRRHYMAVLDGVGLISVDRTGEEHKWVLSLTDKAKKLFGGDSK
jgi:predicted ABC-type ATPase